MPVVDYKKYNVKNFSNVYAHDVQEEKKKQKLNQDYIDKLNGEMKKMVLSLE